MTESIDITLEESILPIKVQQLVAIIMEQKQIDFTDALHYLSSTDIYQHLGDEDKKWWYASGLYLYDLMEEEKNARVATELASPKVQLFLCFCYEHYIRISGKSTTEVLYLFEKYGCFDFIKSNYDVLHTQSMDYIMSAIDEYISNGE
jgi:hypothetical protein